MLQIKDSEQKTSAWIEFKAWMTWTFGATGAVLSTRANLRKLRWSKSGKLWLKMATLSLQVSGGVSSLTSSLRNLLALSARDPILLAMVDPKWFTLKVLSRKSPGTSSIVGTQVSSLTAQIMWSCASRSLKILTMPPKDWHRPPPSSSWSMVPNPRTSSFRTALWNLSLGTFSKSRWQIVLRLLTKTTTRSNSKPCTESWLSRILVPMVSQSVKLPTLKRMAMRLPRKMWRFPTSFASDLMAQLEKTLISPTTTRTGTTDFNKVLMLEMFSTMYTAWPPPSLLVALKSKSPRSS